MNVRELIEILRLLPENTSVTADNSYGDPCYGLFITYKETYPSFVNFSKENQDTLQVGGYVNIDGCNFSSRERYPKGVHLSQNIKWLQKDKEKPYKEKKKYLYSELSGFIKRAQQRGFATFDELREALLLEINNRYDIDSVFSILDEVRIKVIPTRDDESLDWETRYRRYI